MATKLVIVESPAKAKTIGSYLGKEYEVLASVGHVRDLVQNARALPEDVRKAWWADYGVDVDSGYRPYYEVSSDRSDQVRKLKAALKGKEELVLATDEDREGEAISWHLLEVLKPPKTVKVKRIAFHEITREAIRHAVDHPRDLDRDLVEAQETRRILDRLYGYTLSPVLWQRVMRNLSAGRVQSPAVKLIVERERERREFRSATFWDLHAEFEGEGKRFGADLRVLDGKRVASGGDFDPKTGQLAKEREGKVTWLDAEEAGRLAAIAREAKPYLVRKVEEKEGQEKPRPPFMTTTLQQDANRKYGFAADRTMRAAQGLYEGIDLGGESVGLITYMRTDSLALSKEALGGIRGYIEANHPDCLPAKPVTYANKVKNAQEAHEAIRPTDVRRRPEDVARYLNEDQRKIYDLIWRRTVASQMLPARVLRTEAQIGVEAEGRDLVFFATGRQVVFDGWLRVYTEGRDDADDESRLLPRLKEGNPVDLAELRDVSHTTLPPARYTDATLIKALEDRGIGRPSTYASILKVIEDRDYARKQGKQLVPTFKAFLAMEVLEGHFGEVMDLGFTSRMDEVLDKISEGKGNRERYLEEFFRGERGLKTLVEERKAGIPFPNFEVGAHPETGEPIVVRYGKDGSAFLQLGEDGNRRFASVPEDLAPADLTVEKAVELLDQKAAPAESLGFDPTTGRRLLLKNRQGYYLEVERTPEEVEAKVKPTWISLPPDEDPYSFGPEDLLFFANLPKEIGPDPETGEPITFRLGKFGAYVSRGKENRTVPDWRQGRTMTPAEAHDLLAQPPVRARREPAAPLLQFERDGQKIRVLSGRFGPYVTDGETNATLPKGTDPATLTQDQALELLARKREAGPSAKRPVRRKAVAKKAPAKKPAARKRG